MTTGTMVEFLGLRIDPQESHLLQSKVKQYIAQLGYCLNPLGQTCSVTNLCKDFKLLHIPISTQYILV